MSHLVSPGFDALWFDGDTQTVTEAEYYAAWLCGQMFAAHPYGSNEAFEGHYWSMYDSLPDRIRPR